MRQKTHVTTQRPPFERIALILQGGGALGAYQGGVYQALAEANLHPDWVAGISIGAINSALIAGNPPQKRVERLREFWETVSAPPFGMPYIAALEGRDEFTHGVINQVRSWGALVGGAPGFFQPRVPPPFLYPNGAPEALSYYDVAPLGDAGTFGGFRPDQHGRDAILVSAPSMFALATSSTSTAPPTRSARRT